MSCTTILVGKKASFDGSTITIDLGTPSAGQTTFTGTCQVSVIAGRCIDADAWATTLTVLPAAEAQAFATDRGIAARIVGDGVWHSSALRAMFE